MDRSKAEATTSNPQGESYLFKKAFETNALVKSNMTPLEQIFLLRESIQCAQGWCPISTWGLKKIPEHITERLRTSSLEPNCSISIDSGINNTVRLIDFLGCARNPREKIYIDSWENESKVNMIRTHIQLLITEKGEIAVFKTKSYHSGEEVRSAHELEVFLATDEFLAGIIAYPHNKHMHKEMVLRAIDSIAYILYWAQDSAHKRILRFGYGISAVKVILENLKGVTKV